MNTLERIARVAYATMYLPQDLSKTGIKRRQCKKEAKLLREYFRSPDGLQTLIEFYILAQTAHHEPGGLFDPARKQFEFLEAPKEYNLHLNALLQKDKKGIQELITALEKERTQSASGSIAKLLLPHVKNYAAGANNLPIVYTGLKYYYRSFLPVPEKKGILVHIHPDPHQYSSKIKGGYSTADYAVAMKRPLGLITYAHHAELSPKIATLSVIFELRHSYWFSEEHVDIIHHRFPIHNSSEQWKRKIHYLNAVHLLSESGYVLPFLAYEKKPYEEDIRTSIQVQFDTIITQTHETRKKELKQARDILINAQIDLYRAEEEAARANVMNIWQREL